MAYQNIFVEDRWDPEPTVHLWDDEAGYKQFEFQNYGYVLDVNGEDGETLEGESVRRVPIESIGYSMLQRTQEAYGKEEVTFEKDVPIETRVLLDLYGDSEDVSEGHCRFFYDIEVSTEGGYPSVEHADKPITSVAFWSDADEQMRVFLLEDRRISSTDSASVTCFSNEEALLEAFVAAFREADPTILVGYNSDRFDNPYTYRRIRKVLGASKAKQLSPISKVNFLENQDLFKFGGVSSLDYLKLYRNFKFSELNSYALDNVAREELDRGKVEYKGLKRDGETITDLDDLKRLDPALFVEYNIEDVQLLLDFEEKLGFIEMARFISHLGSVPYEDVYKSSRFIEGAILKHLHKNGIVAPNRKRTTTGFKLAANHREGSDVLTVNKEIHDDVPKKGTVSVQRTKTTKKEFEYDRVEGDRFFLKEPLDFDVKQGSTLSLAYAGGFVKEPEPGIYEWFYDLDLTSMYPCIMMSLNISPETKVGKIYEPEWDVERMLSQDTEQPILIWIFDEGGYKELQGFPALRRWLDRNEFAVAANGAIYDTKRKGVIPAVLEEWFENRQEYKKLRNEAESKGNEELAEFYDSQQHNRKILINSVYGVLGLPIFRFYDIDNAEATTLTGQSTIKFTQKMGDAYYARFKERETVEGAEMQEHLNRCLYTDTDSVFYSALPLLSEVDLETGDEKQKTRAIIEEATKVQSFLNRSYDHYAERLLRIPNGHMFQIKQELVASRGIWVRKKRYAQWVVNDEGHPTSKMDVVGMDIIRSDFPEAFKNVLKNVVKTILVNKDQEEAAERILNFKETFKERDIREIAHPTGISKVQKWVGEGAKRFAFRAPIHAKSAIAYNLLIKHFGIDKEYEGIKGGDKMRWVYLHDNPMGFDSMGFKGVDDPPRVVEFIERYADFEKMYEKSLESKLRDVYDAIHWDFPSVQRQKAKEFFQF